MQSWSREKILSFMTTRQETTRQHTFYTHGVATSCLTTSGQFQALKFATILSETRSLLLTATTLLCRTVRVCNFFVFSLSSTFYLSSSFLCPCPLPFLVNSKSLLFLCPHLVSVLVLSLSMPLTFLC